MYDKQAYLTDFIIGNEMSDLGFTEVWCVSVGESNSTTSVDPDLFGLARQESCAESFGGAREGEESSGVEVRAGLRGVKVNNAWSREVQRKKARVPRGECRRVTW